MPKPPALWFQVNANIYESVIVKLTKLIICHAALFVCRTSHLYVELSSCVELHHANKSIIYM